MRDLITVWSDVNYCEWAAITMKERLEKLGYAATFCYNQEGLPSVGNEGDVIRLAIIIIDMDKDEMPVMRAIRATLNYNPTIPIILVRAKEVKEGDRVVFRMHGVVPMCVSNEALMERIYVMSGVEPNKLISAH